MTTDTVLEGMRKRIEVLEAERTELERDAWRWRWLRHQRGWPVSESIALNMSPEDFDSLADDGLQREGKIATPRQVRAQPREERDLKTGHERAK